jgi:hypothetical protein
MALSGQSNHARVCPLSDQSRQSWILARDGLSAFDPKQTFARGGKKKPRLLKIGAKEKLDNTKLAYSTPMDAALIPRPLADNGHCWTVVHPGALGNPCRLFSTS